MTNSEVITLKEFIEAKLHAQSTLFETKLAAMDKATCLATKVLEKRLETLKFITPSEHDLLIDRITKIENCQAAQEGKASQKSVNKVNIISIISLLVAAISILLRFVVK